jgi:hypothetical protein
LSAPFYFHFEPADSSITYKALGRLPIPIGVARMAFAVIIIHSSSPSSCALFSPSLDSPEGASPGPSGITTPFKYVICHNLNRQPVLENM